MLRLHNLVLDHVPLHQFHFLHLQLAMRRVYYGPGFGISTETMSFTQVQGHCGSWASPKVTALFSIQATICPTPLGLVLRTQDIMLFRGRRLDLLSPNPRSEDIHATLELYVCAHLSRKEFTGMIQSLVQIFKDGDKNPSFTYTCDRCNVDSQTEICELNNDIALIVTRWISLGPGLTPDDPRWRIHNHENPLVEEGRTLDANDKRASPRVLWCGRMSPC